VRRTLSIGNVFSHGVPPRLLLHVHYTAGWAWRFHTAHDLPLWQVVLTLYVPHNSQEVSLDLHHAALRNGLAVNEWLLHSQRATMYGVYRRDTIHEAVTHADMHCYDPITHVPP
jgi:hypothetical protein